MQLKRDNDYAIRILVAAAQAQLRDPNKGSTVFELSKATSVPITIVSRLCEKLCAARLMKAKKPLKTVTKSYLRTNVKNNVKYFLYKNTPKKSLWDIIQAIEGDNRLFSVFDQSSELYCACREYFEAIETDLCNSLDNVCIKDLLKMINEKQANEP